MTKKIREGLTASQWYVVRCCADGPAASEVSAIVDLLEVLAFFVVPLTTAMLCLTRLNVRKASSVAKMMGRSTEMSLQVSSSSKRVNKLTSPPTLTIGRDTSRDRPEAGCKIVRSFFAFIHRLAVVNTIRSHCPITSSPDVGVQSIPTVPRGNINILPTRVALDHDNQACPDVHLVAFLKWR